MFNSLFCDKCSRILKIEFKEEKYFGLCNCGFIKELLPESLVSKEMIAKEEKGEGIVGEDISLGFPHVCKKCSYEECEIFDLGVFYGDESNIYLYKCKKCGYVERQADGTGNL